jgi:phage terminase small subunit
MTTKQKIFVKEYVETKGNGTKAALIAYDTKDYQTAATISNENLKKPEIISALQLHNELIESTLIGTVKQYGRSKKLGERSLAVDTAKYIHDKIHGKATQRTESTSNSLIAHISNKPYTV